MRGFPVFFHPSLATYGMAGYILLFTSFLPILLSLQCFNFEGISLSKSLLVRTKVTLISSCSIFQIDVVTCTDEFRSSGWSQISF